MFEKEAEEYFKTTYPAYIGCDKFTEDIKDAVIYGLEAGKTKWHDLRKDSNDLPEKMGLGSKEVYVAYKDGVTDFAYYRFDKRCWERSENEQLAENIVAWCEIPQFEE